MSLRRAAFRAVAAGLLAAPCARAQHPLVALPLGDPAYVQLDALQRGGCTAARVSPYRPFRVGLLRAALARAAGEVRCAGPVLEYLASRFGTDTTAPAAPASRRVTAGAAIDVRTTARRDAEFRPLWRDVRPDSLGDRAVVGIARARVTWNGGERLVAVAEGYAQSDRRNDPRHRGRGFRETSAVVDYSDAYLAGRLGPLVLGVGRTSEAWLGEGDESLVVSSHGTPLDRVSAEVRWSRFEARAFFSTLDDVVLDARDSLPAGVPAQRVHRFLAAHALTFRPTPRWEFTLGETALLARRGAGFELAFANPLMFYVVSENDSSHAGAFGDDNNLAAFGALRYAGGPATLQAELLIDDIQIDAEDRENNPDKLGWRVAATLALPLGVPASVGLEYKRVDSYTYLRDFYAQAYALYDQPLGSELGPDADLLRATGEVWANGRLRVSAGVGRWRRGALRIDTRPGPRAFGHAGEPFPSVTVARPSGQTGMLGDGSVEFLDRVFPITIRAEIARLDNVNGEPALSATYFRAQLVGSYRFRYP
ncbi:MAG: capsule assembly Wzi family protein [Gemmatimonadaceae bacterium]